MLSKACGDMIEGNSEYTGKEIIVNEDNCGDNDNFLDNLFDADKDQRNREQEEDQESGDASNKNDKQDNISINQDSADGVKTGKKKKKEDDQVDTETSKGTIRKDIADQERQESTQPDSPKELTKSQKKRLWKKEKRKRDQEENQKSGVASNRSDKEDDTSIKEDSADGVENGRMKKKKEEAVNRWYLR